MDLNFLNTNDCTNVSVETPTEDFNYISYMSQESVKDFSNVAKYEIKYSTNNCELSQQNTIEVAPNYQFEASILSCEVIGSLGGGAASSYKIELKGINPDLIDEFFFCGGAVCFTFLYEVTGPNSIAFSPLGVTLPMPALREFKLRTKAGFEYLISFDIINQTTHESCNGSIDNFTVIQPTLPTIVDSPSSTISLNTLFSLPSLIPALYYISICEVDHNGNTTILENQVFLECDLLDSCGNNNPCDSTEDICNLSKAVQSKHQSIIFGLQCCKQASLNIMKHYIRIVCPDELKC